MRARWLAAAGAVVAGGAAAGLIVVTSGPAAGSGHAASGSGGTGQASWAGGGSRVATALVVRTDLTNTVQVSGALGFAGSYTVANQMQGTAYTALPPLGQVVRRGRRLYEVDGSPVILLYGARPEWRDLFLGVTPGPDVAQLDANLIALGYATPATLAVSDTFTSATSVAMQRWQAALGMTVTGVVTAGQVAYAPGPLRVASLDVTLGAAAQPGAAVLAATSARSAVSAELPVAPGVPGSPGRPGHRHTARRHQHRPRRHHRHLSGGQRRIGRRRTGRRGDAIPGAVRGRRVRGIRARRR